MLVKENSNPDYTILIHRTSKATKEDFFKNGLFIAGGNDLEYTTSRYDGNNMTMLINIRDTAAYKNEYSTDGSSRCVIMKIPNTALQYVKGKTKPILYQTDNIAEQSGGMLQMKGQYQTVLLPEYILGTVEFEHGKMTEFAKNPNYTDLHNYKNDGLVCPQETIDSYREQKGVEKEDILINKMIAEENDKYMLQSSVEYEKCEEKRTETDIKEYSKKEMLLSKFNEMVRRIKNFFTKDRTKEENSKDVDQK